MYRLLWKEKVLQSFFLRGACLPSQLHSPSVLIPITHEVKYFQRKKPRKSSCLVEKHLWDNRLSPTYELEDLRGPFHVLLLFCNILAQGAYILIGMDRLRIH